jgi:GTP cyclohydrolase II
MKPPMGPRPKLSAVPANAVVVGIAAKALLPTHSGKFEIVAFADSEGNLLDDVALVHGDVRGAEVVPVRVHSECLTGDVFGSLRCDCGEQLHRALEQLASSPAGVILYMRQEGRGIGIANKVAAYALQDRGLDTVDANRHLGFDDDLRHYDVAGAMLVELGVRRIDLLTNNPRKVEGLRTAGIDVVHRTPIVIEARPENEAYLATKRTRSGHLADE